MDMLVVVPVALPALAGEEVVEQEVLVLHLPLHLQVLVVLEV
jgi:hypothetical protein